jgi:hypothetical protein
MPSFLASNPVRVHGLRRRLDNIEQPAMRAHLELLATFLVDVRRAIHGEPLDMRGQRDWSANPGTRALGGVHDLFRAVVQHAMIVRLEPDADVLIVHRSVFRGVPSKLQKTHALQNRRLAKPRLCKSVTGTSPRESPAGGVPAQTSTSKPRRPNFDVTP